MLNFHLRFAICYFLAKIFSHSCPTYSLWHLTTLSKKNINIMRLNLSWKFCLQRGDIDALGKLLQLLIP